MGQPLELSAQATLQALAAHGVVPVVRFNQQDAARQAVRLLYEAGFRTFEITLTVPGALELIAELRHQADLLVGAGTVLSVADAARCLEAGARYLVTPVLLADLAPLCRDAGALCVMSGLTPSEVYAAWQHGAHAVKVFPASSMGGPPYLRALKSVFPDIPLVPTGGVNLTNLRDYLGAGALFVGVGSDLLSDHDLAERQAADLIAHARRYLDILEAL
jgi:2-dehydro-3-deoxyphosphogluconate aldolase/(4S)-4-hydroxy-2-oxoglutarate aldolase